MSQANYSVVTTYGREWNARAAAGEEVSPITEMVFGDGDRAPTGGETALVNEVHRQTLSGQGSYEDQSAAYFDAYLEAAIGGFVIREHGLVTADGNLVAIGVRNPGIPKADPATGAADDFTYRIDLFFDQLDALVVEVDPRHGLTAERRVDTGDGLTGGGALGTDLTLAIDRQRLFRPKRQKIILLSDLQPDANAAHGAEQVALSDALIDSVATHHKDADFVFFPGDVSDRGQPTAAEIAGNAAPYISLADQRRNFERLPVGIASLYAIPGNHDVNYEDAEDHPEGETFTEFLRHFPSTCYHIEMGNMVVIFMGDEARGTPGTISDETVDWWEEIVLAHQDSFIITVTHQSLEGTINADSSSDNINIIGSDRFISRMTRAEHPAKVHLWLCGHHGSYSMQHLDHRTAVAHNGCRFVQIGAHIPSIVESGPDRPAVYWAMELADGETEVTLRQWDHDDAGFVSAHEITVDAPAPLQLRSAPQFDGRFQRHARFDPQRWYDLELSAQSVTSITRQEIRLRRLEGAPTANMETAL